jgi:hypothetical protein
MLVLTVGAYVALSTSLALSQVLIPVACASISLRVGYCVLFLAFLKSEAKWCSSIEPIDGEFNILTGDGSLQPQPIAFGIFVFETFSNAPFDAWLKELPKVSEHVWLLLVFRVPT